MNSVLELLEKQAAERPDKIAFSDENSSCTFSELRCRARKIACGLMKIGVKGQPVPLLMDKSPAAMCLMMGVVYAGGFYVILDATQPKARLDSILQTLSPKVMIIDENLKEVADTLEHQAQVIFGSSLMEEEADDALLAAMEAQRMSTDPLYGIFTSGSTGTPKGVVVSHGAVIDFIHHFTEAFRITDEDVLGNQAPWDFDVSVKDIYSGLYTGAEVVLIPMKMFSFPLMLLEYLEAKKVTNLTWAVSALCMVSALDGLSAKRPEHIRRIMFSGEVMPIRHLNYWRGYYPEAMFVNLYGPTEITCNCTYYILDREFEPGEAMPLGIPFRNRRVFLLDEENRLVTEPGVEGAICVTGVSLALGYYRNEEQTKKAFYQNPLNHDYPERMYNTGDIARYDEDGNLYFMSRRDFQIKHMGHRIELGEIENALEKVEEIIRSCCFFDTEKGKIVCFYQGDINKRELSRKIGQWLPDFMRPNVYRPIDSMPLTKNGKTDRKKLQAIYKEEKRSR